jgi:hypothetical protein
VSSDILYGYKDIYTPAAPGSLMRSIRIEDNGKFRVARRDCELYSVQIAGNGAWSKLKISNGEGRELFHMPSCFTGSFVVGGESEGGLYIEVSATVPPNLTINFREMDRETK